MTKKVFLVFICFFATDVFAQDSRAVVPPGESIFLHTNTTLFVTGETLYFKIYCLQNNRLSDVSKVAYLELIDQKGKPALQTKIKLDKGLGAGEYFFGSNTPSGNYTLVAYTKWMRNFGIESFYRRNIIVINPGDLPPAPVDTIKHDARETAVTRNAQTLILDKSEYGQREKVNVIFKSGPAAPLHLSLSVRPFTVDAQEKTASHQPVSPSLITFLPDLRGELMTGTIIDKSSGNPMEGVMATLSAPSENFAFLISKTDMKGRYAFNVRNVSGPVYITTINHAMNTLEIRPDNPYLNSYDSFLPPKLFLDTAMLRSLGRRYLASQIQNTFQQTREDSITGPVKKERFFSSPSMIYHLDDFTRFPTMEDVFREIVPEIVVKLKDGNFSLTMRNNITAERFYTAPLVLIDGIPVLDANVVMKYDPLLVKDIALMAHRYFYNGFITEGIISIETYAGRAEGLDITQLLRLSYTAPQEGRSLEFPIYDEQEGTARIPDYRTQLYWNPNVEVATNETVSFYTGDVPGTYIVDIKGVNSTGEIIQFHSTFIVK